MVFFQEIHVFLHIAGLAYLEKKGGFLHCKNSDWQEVFLPKLTHFSHFNNVLDAEVYNFDGFLWRDT
jgi:hypothetical protein